MGTFAGWAHLGVVALGISRDSLMFLGMALRSRVARAAENLFLRKQLALYRERQVKPRRASDATRLGLVLLARCFAWHEALTLTSADHLSLPAGEGSDGSLHYGSGSRSLSLMAGR